jgi:hypothetical protein
MNATTKRILSSDDEVIRRLAIDHFAVCLRDLSIQNQPNAPTGSEPSSFVVSGPRSQCEPFVSSRCDARRDLVPAGNDLPRVTQDAEHPLPTLSAIGAYDRGARSEIDLRFLARVRFQPSMRKRNVARQLGDIAANAVVASTKVLIASQILTAGRISPPSHDL